MDNNQFHKSKEFLDHKAIDHRNYQETLNILRSSCSAMLRGSVVALVGPNRVGKTMLVQEALEIDKFAVPDVDQSMRSVWVDVRNNSRGAMFSPKAFYLSCLDAIHHPTWSTFNEGLDEDMEIINRRHRATEAVLAESFERALVQRQTEYLIFDEAHHVLYAPGADSPTRILDSFKVLAQAAKVKVVLIGSYPLIAAVNRASHMVGRSQWLHFAPYSATDEDAREWINILRDFTEGIQPTDAPSLCNWAAELLDGTMGRVGALSLWLRSSLAYSHAKGLHGITEESLRATTSSDSSRASVLAEMMLGKRLLESTLWLPEGARLMEVTPRPPIRVETYEMIEDPLPPKKPQKKAKPFQRKSRRIPHDHK